MLTRKPTFMIANNSEIIKAIPSFSDVVPEEAPTVYLEASYNTPSGRESGNQLFRRYANGMLDIKDCSCIVLDALYKVKDAAALTSLEQVALSVVFPTIFDYVSSIVASVQCRLSAQEILDVQMEVALNLQQQRDHWMSSSAG